MIQKDLKKTKLLMHTIVKICQKDIFFSHTLIFNLLSHYFVEEIKFINASNDIMSMLQRIVVDSKSRFRMSTFIRGLHLLDITDKMQKIRSQFRPYVSIIGSETIDFTKTYENTSDDEFAELLYMSSLNFWSDIKKIAELVDHKAPSKEKKFFIISQLKMMNKQLPSFIFIPSISISNI